MKTNSKNKNLILTELYENFNKKNQKSKDSYKGFNIHALPGLHDYIENFLKKNKIIQIGLKTIEIGAGSGAMSLRYKDLGLDITSIDYVPENFMLPKEEFNFTQCDCNGQFSTSIRQKADFISAIEIIEHLENPRNFIRECKALLNTNGYLLVTTPNIECSKSKIDFILENSFHLFKDTSYKSSGHITPISTWQLYKIFTENQLYVLDHLTFGKNNFDLRKRPKAFILQNIVRLISSSQAWGDNAIHVILLKNT